MKKVCLLFFVCFLAAGANGQVITANRLQLGGATIRGISKDSTYASKSDSLLPTEKTMKNFFQYSQVSIAPGYLSKYTEVVAGKKYLLGLDSVPLRNYILSLGGGGGGSITLEDVLNNGNSAEYNDIVRVNMLYANGLRLYDAPNSGHGTLSLNDDAFRIKNSQDSLIFSAESTGIVQMPGWLPGTRNSFGPQNFQTRSNFFYFPDSTGVLPLRIKLNGTWINPDNKGTFNVTIAGASTPTLAQVTAIDSNTTNRIKVTQEPYRYGFQYASSENNALIWGVTSARSSTTMLPVMNMGGYNFSTSVSRIHSFVIPAVDSSFSATWYHNLPKRTGTVALSVNGVMANDWGDVRLTIPAAIDTASMLAAYRTRAQTNVDTIAAHNLRIGAVVASDALKANLSNPTFSGKITTDSLIVNNKISFSGATTNGAINLNPTTTTATGGINFDATNALFRSSSSTVTLSASFFAPKYIILSGGFAIQNGSGNTYLTMSSTSGSTIGADAANSSPTLIINNSNASSTGDIIQFKNSGGTQVVVNQSGRVAIGASTVDASASLDIVSTTRGVLFPRMTNTQKGAIASPATGLTVYCIDCTATDASTGVMQTYNGSAWKNNW